MVQGIAGAGKQASVAQDHLGRLNYQSTTTHTDVKFCHAATPSHQAMTTARLLTAYNRTD